MVPDKFNMVDMEGIDILFRYGDAIPGLYQKLVESITQCRYQCLYNWYFDSVLIPPTYVEMTVIDNKVWIEDGVSVDEEDTLGFLAPGLKTVTGAIAHITDALAKKADQLVCYINPNQDLHGYNHPWAAGTGKNKAEGVEPATLAGITLTVRNNGEVVANGIATQDVVFSGNSFVADAGNYYLNGCPDGGNLTNTYDVFMWDITTSGRPKKWNGTTAADSVFNSNEQSEVKIESGHRYSIRIRIRNGYNANNVVFRPMLRLATETDASFEPYSNICPITGYTGLNVYRESSYDTEADPVIMDNWQDIAGTVYGGVRNMDVGKLIVTDAEIASYNGEALPSTWISSMDVYAVGATPTVGAQVVYKLAEPLIYDLAVPQLFTLLQGENYIWQDANGDISVTYWYNKF